MSSAHVACDVGTDGVAVLTIDNPPVNAVTVSIARELGQCAVELDARTDVGVVIVTGCGERFSAGSDIAEFSTMLSPGTAVRRKLRPQMLAFSQLAEMRVPNIAALNGVCLGGGLEIAVCCDLIVAEEHIKIGPRKLRSVSFLVAPARFGSRDESVPAERRRCNCSASRSPQRQHWTGG